MKDKITALKADVKVWAAKSLEVSQSRRKYKAENTDKQSEKYQYAMVDFCESRQSCRFEGRVRHLAYNYVRKVPYSKVEAHTILDRNGFKVLQDQIAQLLTNLGIETEDDQIEAWMIAVDKVAEEEAA